MSPLLDTALIAAAQKVEHYEIAGYGSLIALAKQLGETESVKLLAATLEEEKATAQRLSLIAEENWRPRLSAVSAVRLSPAAPRRGWHCVSLRTGVCPSDRTHSTTGQHRLFLLRAAPTVTSSAGAQHPDNHAAQHRKPYRLPRTVVDEVVGRFRYHPILRNDGVLCVCEDVFHHS
jgi:hypothetical protein